MINLNFVFLTLFLVTTKIICSKFAENSRALMIMQTFGTKSVKLQLFGKKNVNIIFQKGFIVHVICIMLVSEKQSTNHFKIRVVLVFYKILKISIFRKSIGDFDLLKTKNTTKIYSKVMADNRMYHMTGLARFINTFSACFVLNPILVVNYAAFFNCTLLGRASESKMAPT